MGILTDEREVWITSVRIMYRKRGNPSFSLTSRLLPVASRSPAPLRTKGLQSHPVHFSPSIEKRKEQSIKNLIWWVKLIGEDNE